MDSFYSIVLLIAFILLLLALIAIGIMLQKQGDKVAFPSQNSPCPDGWGIKDNGHCEAPGASHPNYPSNLLDASGSFTPFQMTMLQDWDISGSSDWKPKDSSTICDLRDWTIAHSVQWDGISNYNSCV
tara:strand:- start:2143 stop:2526 length:384 start_codon:yes stop_codon:yes gene_type:complete